MKKILSAILVIFFLSACGVSVTPSPTPTETIIPTATSTNTPIPTPTLTPTPTAVPIPEFMNEFINLGYDKQSLNSTSIYVVLDEKNTFYPSDKWGGMKYGNSILYGWSKVYYISNGLLQTNFVVINFCMPHPTVKKFYFCYFTPSDNINQANDPPSTTTWTQAGFNDLQKHSVGDYPIVRIEFNSEHFDARNDFSNFPSFSFWENIYPNFNESFSTFEIPNIGTFIPATYVGYDFSEGKWLKNP